MSALSPPAVATVSRRLILGGGFGTVAGLGLHSLPAHQAGAQARAEPVAAEVRSRDGMHEPELDEIRNLPLWSDMVALAPTWLPEIEAIAALPLGVDRYRRLSAPTLLLLGTLTQRHHVIASEALEQTLPNARTVRLEGQGHQANVAVPDIVAGAIARFLAPRGG